MGLIFNKKFTDKILEIAKVGNLLKSYNILY